MRRALTVLALLGCVVHATLLPWHSASRLAARFDAAALAADLGVICHNGLEAEAAQLASDGTALPAQVPTDQTDCPICKGIMGFQVALLVAAELGLLAPAGTAEFLRPASHDVPHSLTARPRSRGPPALA